MDGILHREATAFFDAFVEAFTSFDGARIAERYSTPYHALHADGSAHCYLTPADIAAYFQGILDQYKAQGCQRCTYSAPEVQPLGARSAVASVTWHLHGGQGAQAHVISSWRESYTLTRRAGDRPGQLCIAASVDH